MHQIFHSVIIVAVLSLAFVPCYAQQGTISGPGEVTYNQDGTVTVDGTKVFTSHIINDGEDIDRMVIFDALGLFRLGADLSGGIKATVGHGGHVVLSVYAYDAKRVAGRGALLYRKTLYHTSTSEYAGDPDKVIFKGMRIDTDNIKNMLLNAGTNFVEPSKMPAGDDLNLFRMSMAYLNGQVPPLLNSPLYNGLKGNNYQKLQPVIVETIVANATVMAHGLRFPGMVEEFDLANYFGGGRQMQVRMFVNGIARRTYSAGNLNPDPIDLVMGDSIRFEVTYKGNQAPTILGVPNVWIARFAGDLMYYCTPNTKPGEFNPWIGYDSRVHNMQVRQYSGDSQFRLKVPTWQKTNDIWSWGSTAKRRMNSSKKKYTAPHTWIKYKILKGGAKQRNNQREGLNIQFLNYWQNGLNSNYSAYSGEAKYVMGFDDDELFYMNDQYYDAMYHPPYNGGIAKLDSIPSRGMPEGYEQIYDLATGYPAQGFPLDIVITAYKKNREWNVASNKNYFDIYNGYEIQDIGTDEEHPFGIGAGNVTAPGLIKVRAGNQIVNITVDVKAPFTTDKGMYGNLSGNTWPAVFQPNIPYTLDGLTGMSVTELERFSMVYEGSDALGNISRQVRELKDLTLDQKKEISKSGKWTTTFNNSHPTYACVTAYYQRSPNYSKVIVAGKELKSIFLLFFGESKLEGKGLGAKIWLNDFRLNKTGDYTVPRQFGDKTKYMTPYVRTYTFPVNTTTTYEVWDGDPHLFYDSGTEWFLSSRTLAERIPDSYLDGTAPGVSEPYLKFYIDGVEQKTGRIGKTFTCKWTSPGEHMLRVTYLIDGGLTSYQHKINVVNYPTYAPLGKRLAKIEVRPLTQQEATWLKVSLPSPYRVFTVKDIYSEYEYKTGPRVYMPYINRWAEHNDFAAQFMWNKQNVEEVETFLHNYTYLGWFWRNWALHYSSNWRDHFPYGLPSYVPNEYVTRITTTQLNNFSYLLSNIFKDVRYAHWQATIPLVSYTDYQGNRMRTNPSCIYDVSYLWNNYSGAFSGKPFLPPSSTYIQAPDISDDDKGRQEFFLELESGRKAIFNIRGNGPIPIVVRNVYDVQNTFISELDYYPESNN